MNHVNTLCASSASTKLKKPFHFWWAALPAEKRPVRCAKEFPHIVNRIVDSWEDFYTCEHYLHGLLHERERAHRQGFCREVADEIRQLYDLLLRQTLVVSAAVSMTADAARSQACAA